MTKRFLVVLLVAMVGIGAAVVRANSLICQESQDQRRFDPVAWKKAEGTGNPVRLLMVDDLLRRFKLVDMTRSEIESLLGVPAKTDYFPDFDYVYWLGPERGPISIDSEWLGVKFRNDVVIAVAILRD